MNNTKSMTALVSLFIRAYHTKRSVSPVFFDENAEKLLTKEEFETVASSLENGAPFFLPGFKGEKGEALDRIVNGILAAPVVSRSAFFLSAFENAKALGAKQLLLFGSGYDSSAYSKDFDRSVKVFELDREEMIKDKLFRLERAGLDFSHVAFVPCDLSGDFEKELLKSGFESGKSSFAAALGLCHYLSREEFSAFLKKLSKIFPEGSSLVFDYPLCSLESAEVAKKLADEANEKMKAGYRPFEIEELLSSCGFRIYEHLEKEEIQRRFFDEHNLFSSESGKIVSPGDFALCLAVKK